MRASSPLEERVLDLIEPVSADLGLRIVRVRLTGLRRKRLQIMAERVADGGMAMEDCERLSRALSPALDAADPIPGEYDLEVSSPGIDRPLTAPEDFARFVGHEAKLETRDPVDGRRKFRGEIQAADGARLTLAVADGPAVTLPIEAVREARLVLTDKLIAEDLKRAERAAAAPDQERKPQ